MSKNKYRISQQAIEDLDKIWIYTFNKWSREQADRYYDSIIAEIEFIASNYLIGKSALIFYRKVDNEIVEIIRVLHQRMDIKKRLK